MWLPRLRRPSPPSSRLAPPTPRQHQKLPPPRTAAPARAPSAAERSEERRELRKGGEAARKENSQRPDTEVKLELFMRRRVLCTGSLSVIAMSDPSIRSHGNKLEPHPSSPAANLLQPPELDGASAEERRQVCSLEPACRSSRRSRASRRGACRAEREPTRLAALAADEPMDAQSAESLFGFPASSGVRPMMGAQVDCLGELQRRVAWMSCSRILANRMALLTSCRGYRA